MADATLDRLRASLDRFHQTGDTTHILGSDVARDIRAVAAHPDLAYDLTVVQIIAWLHWYRSLAMPGDEARNERAAAAKLFELVYVADAQAVPGPLQEVLRERRLTKQTEFARSIPFQPALDIQRELRRAAEQFQRFQLTNDRATLDDAIGCFRRLSAAMPAGNMLRPLVDVMLGMALFMLSERTGDSGVLAECVQRLRGGVDGLPAGHEMRPAAQMWLCGALQFQWLGNADPALLAESAELARQAQDSAAPGSPLSGLIDMACGLMRAADPANAGDPGGIDQAIATARQALQAVPPGDARRPHLVMNLGMALASRFQVTQMADTLDESVALLREADAAMPAADPQRPALRGMLGAALAELSRERADPALGEEAVGLMRESLAGTDEEHLLFPVLLANYGVGLWHLYTGTGEPHVLDEAIETGRRAVERLPSDGPALPLVLHNLGAALHDRFRATGDVTALREALELARRSERTVPPGSPEQRHAIHASTVGLLMLHQRTGDPAAACEAVSTGRRALGMTPKDHPERTVYAVTLAQALQEAGHGADPAPRHEAITLLRDEMHAIAARARTPADLQYVANALGTALLGQAAAEPELSTVEEATIWLRRATAGAPPSPSRDRCLGLLGKALQVRHELTRDRSALTEALAAFSAASATDGSPIMRVLRHIEVGRTAATLADWPAALAGFTAAVGALPEVAHRRLPRADQEFGLTRLSGVAAEAAACALNARAPERALELLEQGRGVLLAQTLQTKAYPGEVAVRDPQRAARLSAIGDQLGALARLDLDPPSVPAQTGAAASRAEWRRRLAAEWDDLLAGAPAADTGATVRLPRLGELSGLAGEGAVIVLNVSRYRSDAILVTPAGLSTVPLGRTFFPVAAERAIAFTAAMDGAMDPDEERRGAARSVVQEILGWLWDDVAGPVLGRLQMLGSPEPPAAMPRVWWCAGGPLALLPLHAAGRGDIAVIDKVISSYTPTLQALRHARARRRPADPAAGLLAVALSRTPGEPDLSWAADEMRWLQQTFGAAKLLNEEATRDRVLAALPNYPIAHFACHGVTDLESPSASALRCHDHREHPLTVAHVSRLDLANAALAYLSACSTARTRHDLADEAIHLTTAFVLAGYAQVVGTLWNVDDQTANKVTRLVYQTMAGDGTRSAAFALHDALRTVRATGAHPAAWCPFIHVGA